MFSVMLMHFMLFAQVFADDEVETTTKSDRFCRERNRPVTSDKDDLFNLAEAVVGEKIMLQCHFCKETDDGLAKNWFKLDKSNDSVKYEVQLGMENNMSFNRIHLDLENTLVIHNLTENDGGEYFCKGLEDEGAIYKYNFFVDVIEDTDIVPETGNLSVWKKYSEEQFLPINKLFQTATGPEYTFLRDKMNLIVELVTEWDPAGPCEICGRPKGDGRRKKKGRCRFKIYSKSNKTVESLNFHEKTLLRASHLSCRSLTLRHLIPDIMNKTQVIPDFVEIEKCDGICNPDAEGLYKGWKTTKKSGYKYRKTFVLAENAHLTIICPESTLENKVVWKVNGIKINPGESVEAPSPDIEPRITVDSFNTLYLYGVTKEEEGNYTCHVDDVRMQMVRVFVVSKAKLLTQAFFRHMMYLAFVLSLTLSCYCAGLVITWFKRSSFKTFEDVQAELKRKKRFPPTPDDSYDIEKGKQNKNNSDEFKKLLSSSTTEPKTETTSTTKYDNSSTQDTLNDQYTLSNDSTPKEKYFSDTTTTENTDSDKPKRKWFFSRKKKPAAKSKQLKKLINIKSPRKFSRSRSDSSSTSTDFEGDVRRPLLKEFDGVEFNVEDEKIEKSNSVDLGNFERNNDPDLIDFNGANDVEKSGGNEDGINTGKKKGPVSFSEPSSSDFASDSDKRKVVGCFGRKSTKNKRDGKNKK